MEVVKLNQKAVNKAVEFLSHGGVVVFPTDTVYGFLADAKNKKAVDKIYKIKKRAKLKPLPVFIGSIKTAKNFAEINKEQEKTLKRYWPGKYTFVLEIKRMVKLYGQDKRTIALRIPKYRFLNKLLKRIDKPLVQTSVNISGKPVLTKISDIIKQFNKFDILIIDGGNIKTSKSSKILDLTKDKIKTLRT